jgi:hypothetical protein
VEQLRKRVATLTAASDEPGLSNQEEVLAPAKRSRSGDLPGREPGKADMDT